MKIILKQGNAGKPLPALGIGRTLAYAETSKSHMYISGRAQKAQLFARDRNCPRLILLTAGTRTGNTRIR